MRKFGINRLRAISHRKSESAADASCVSLTTFADYLFKSNSRDNKHSCLRENEKHMSSFSISVAHLCGMKIDSAFSQ
jgi:hypothetical protein